MSRNSELDRLLRPRRQLSLSAKLMLTVVILGLAAGWVWFLGWLVTVVIGWFGPHLAVWQGVVIALLVNALVGGSRKAAKS